MLEPELETSHSRGSESLRDFACLVRLTRSWSTGEPGRPRNGTAGC